MAKGKKMPKDQKRAYLTGYSKGKKEGAASAAKKAGKKKKK